MKVNLVRLFVFLSLFPLSGCSLFIRGVIVNNKDDAAINQLPRIDPNDPNNHISLTVVDKQGERKTKVHILENGFSIDTGENPCRVKFKKDRKFIVSGVKLEAEFIGCSQTYPVIIDTGLAKPILVNDIHILENKLSILANPGGEDGICKLPDLSIGELTFRNLIANCNFHHAEVHLLGFPVDKDNNIYLGLDLLRKFKYVGFDYVNEDVEFSSTKSFSTLTGNSWSNYPFVIKEGRKGNTRLVVRIPMNGLNMNLVFDTGNPIVMLTTEKAWKQMSKEVLEYKKSHKKTFMPFAGGRIAARTVVVKELKVGQNIVTNASVAILPDNNPLFASEKNENGLLGVQCFADSSIVLDFEHNLMWVNDK